MGRDGDGKAEFVVVANRLPVDLERAPDGSENWKRSPGGLVTALEPILRSRRGAWVGWPGLADAQADPFEDDGLELLPRGPLGRGRGELLRGLLQRHALAALPRRRRPAVVPPALVAGVRQGQRAVRRGRRRGRGRGRDGLGAGLPAPAGARPAPRAPPGPADRVLPAHPVPAGRAVPAAPVARADRPGVAGRGPRRLPHAGRCAQLPHAGDPLRRGGRRARRRRLPRSRREARRLPHLDRLRGARQAVPHTRGHRPRRGDPPRAGRPAPPDPRRRPARLHQGHQRPAARLRGAARRGADLGRRHGVPADRHAEPGAGGALHPAARRDRADRRPDQRRPQPDRPSRRCTTCTSRCPGRS